MKRSSASLLQAAIVLIGLGTLVLMLGEPHLEGRNAHATPFEIYFKDPFLAYVYVGSTPFFVALYRAFRLFGHAGQTGAYSPVTVEALRVIKHCAFVLMGFVAGGAVFILLFGDKDDRPPGIFMSLLALCGSGAIAVAAMLFERNLRNALRRFEDR